MSDQEQNKEEQPGIIIPKKKVDSSWKEEVRKEKEKLRADEAEKAAEAGAKGSKKAAPTGEPNKIFLNFIAGLIQQVLMQLGKMENPYGGGQDVDLEGAKYTIELLTVLKEKTDGNLVAKEEQALAESLRELKFHFIETAKAMEEQLTQQAPPPPGQ